MIFKSSYILHFILLPLITMTSLQAQFPYTIKLLTHQEITNALPFVIQQRLTTFSEYPYLYQGTEAEEQAYVNLFLTFSNSAIAIAYYQEKPVGFLMGTSFSAFDQHFQGSLILFKDAGIEPTSYYYFSDLIVVSEHRGRFIGTQLYTVMENFARKQGYTAGCCVTEIYDTHPLKPTNYKSIKNFLTNLGYTQSTLAVYHEWATKQQDGTTYQQVHPLTYWLKNFDIDSL
jgi:GNAT superfamily N-acetyltransferase